MEKRAEFKLKEQKLVFCTNNILEAKKALVDHFISQLLL